MEVEGTRRSEAVISFGPEDLKGVNLPHNDALVIQARGYHLEAVETTLFGFAGHVVYPEGEIILPLTLGSQDCKKNVMTSFTVVDSPSSYNIILGRPALNELKAVVSTYLKGDRLRIKFPVGARVGEVKGDQLSSRKCYVEAVRADQSKSKREEKKARVDEVGGRMGEKREVHFVAEEEQEMELTGISPMVSEHQLNILEGSRPVKQKKRHFGPEKDKVIDEKVKELLRAGHIREIQFPIWLSNVVLVPKSTGKWRIIKLNPAKCIFGVKSGKFLRFIVTDRRIEVNHEKVKSVLCMPSPRSVKEVQKLTGRIAFLSRFISRSAHRSYPFFQVLRKAQQFGWDEKCEQAFQDLKIHLAELPVLVKPEPGEKLFVYLSTTEYAVSSILIKEEGSDQKPVYYVSHALRGLELRYSEVEKIALALVVTARKLRPYFLSHQIIVLTNSTLERIMTHSEVAGRMIKWAVKLGEYDIEYKPLVAIKAQALSDFLSEMAQPDEEEVWRVFVDGASSFAGCGVGVVIVSSTGERIKLAVRIDSRVTNNEAEYEAVLAGIRAAQEIGVSRAKTFVDWGIEQIPREENGEADALAKMAASLSEVSTREVLHVSRLILSTDEEALPAPEDSWITSLIKFIAAGELPEDKIQA
ncbi:uncharacterized protein [Primulina huaijiensis]|uniref:uncharacterized protein n=1 Tax=Primulina huaijiensis TaxID=1492673 RepID=UPI003CC70A6A